jgi:hypothetical protein
MNSINHKTPPVSQGISRQSASVLGPSLLALVFVIAGVSCALSMQVKAQSTYGSILGTVTDASGAAVPNATITVINLGTNESRLAKSDVAGNFSAVNLQPAVYRVVVDSANFKHFVRQPVSVAVGAAVRIDATLQIGAASETVEVSTATPLLQTDSSTIGQQVEGQTVQEMPLNGRNTMNLIALAPGVVPGGSTAGPTGGNQGLGHTQLPGFGNYQIGGSLPGVSSTWVDGGPVNTMGGNLAAHQTALIPTQDAVQEFTVSSNTVSAEFGQFGGGVINMVTKSGTNQTHGSAYEYIRNAFFNANDWWNKRNQLLQSKPNKPVQWNQNQYGAAFGGPAIKDRIFYHFTWEGFRSDTGTVLPTNVPTSALQNGVFNSASSLKDPLGNCTIAPYTGQTVNGQTFPTGGYYIVNLFQGSCGDPMAQVMRGYYPPPNVPGVAFGLNNFYHTPATPDAQNQYNARIDYAVSAQQHIFARYTNWHIEDAGYNELGDYNGWITERAKSLDYEQQAVLGDTYTFSQKTILDLRLAYDRDNSPNATVASYGQDYSKFPSNSYVNQVGNQMTAHIIPQAGVTGGVYNNLWGYSGTCCTIGHDWYNTYTFTGSVIHIIGNHSLKIGGQVEWFQDHNIGGGNSGVFNYTGTYTGDSWADFLLGYEQSSSSITTQVEGGLYNWYQGYYITDTWQATRKLTLNLGLRWELPGGMYEKHDHNTVLLPYTNDPTYSVPGTLALVNSSLYPSRSSFNAKHGLFAPRVGFAYRLNNATVVSAGLGIAYLPLDAQTGAEPVKSPITSNVTNCGTTNTTTPNAAQLMYNCFSSSNPIIAPPERASSFYTLLNFYNNPGKGITGAYPYQKYPYNEQWNFSVSRQLTGTSMVEASYVGAAGIHLPASGNNLNQLADSNFTQGAALNGNGTCGNNVTNNKPLTLGQCLRPYLHYGNVKDSLSYNTQTIYHAMQARGQKRFGAGGTLMGNFTWAKMIGNTDTQLNFLEAGVQGANSSGGGAPSYQDYTNIHAERSPLTYDVPYRAVISYVLGLPIGKGQTLLSNANGVLDRVVSGWAANGITTFQHGFRLPIRDTQITSGANKNNDLNNFGIGSLRPNYVAGCNKTGGLSGTYTSRAMAGRPQFNTSCWTQPSDWTFGNEPRVGNGLFAQGIDNFDFSVLKSTKVTEHADVQFRAEFFNIFNRKQFAQPDASLGDTTFGDVLADNNQPRLVQFSLRVNF